MIFDDLDCAPGATRGSNRFQAALMAECKVEHDDD